jgi:L-methionine (R)-S-oxide reductase
MISPETVDQVLVEIRAQPYEGEWLRAKAMEALSRLPNYNWCGVYRLEGDTLVLDEFVGAHTEHGRIKVGVGVCGTAVAENANQVIADVRELDNYLACSTQTRSEIVVLIRDDETILGQIDIDGHQVGAFDETDEAFLEQVAELLAERWD